MSTLKSKMMLYLKTMYVSENFRLENKGIVKAFKFEFYFEDTENFRVILLTDSTDTRIQPSW